MARFTYTGKTTSLAQRKAARKARAAGKKTFNEETGSTGRVLAKAPKVPYHLHGSSCKITQELIESVSGFVAEGCARLHALHLAGLFHVSADVFFSIGKAETEAWTQLISEGAKQSEDWEPTIMAQMYMRVLYAEAWFKMVQLRQIHQHAKFDWQASKWLLENRFSEEFRDSDQGVFAQLRMVLLTPPTAADEATWLAQATTPIDGECVVVNPENEKDPGLN